MAIAPRTMRQIYTRLLEIAEKYGHGHALDLSIPCPHRKCGAQVAQTCDGQRAGTVHFARRLKRLLSERIPNGTVAPASGGASTT